MKNRTSLRLTDPDAPLAATLDVIGNREFAARRRLLKRLGGAALAVSPAGALACSLIPAETEGPYPADGTNGPNVLTMSGIVRSDIRSSFGSAGTTMATGTPLAFTIKLVNVNNNCAPVAGAAVYAWHCDASGRYSLYSSGATTQNYLRGVQVSDANGLVTFTSIFPGAYSGRWPHIHFEVYESLAAATTGRNAIRTSQIALPDAACREVYAQASLYPGSLTNHNRTTLQSDGIFGNDSAALQLATTTGSIAAGYVSTLEVGVAAAITAASGPDLDQHGLTGNWYNHATNGQGLSLEIYPDMIAAGQGLLFGGWFTFDGSAGGATQNRWYTIGGPVVSGQATAQLVIYRNVAGNFAAPPITTAAEVGTATFTASSCDSGTLTYAFTDGSGRNGTIPLTRLTRNVTCSTTSTRATNADFAHSGNWFSESTSGQGFIFEVNPSSQAFFFTWYTYAVGGQAIGGEASQRWYTAQASYAAGARNLTLTLYETTGGTFASTSTTAVTNAVGAATLAFASCEAATLAYNFTGGANAGQAGTIALTRVGPVPSGCA
ncbi:MAG: intradiol ring-cleavage dioxygenase [Burkholderiales bacterium]|nr:intradiol ring-cleavage dioxygenase [Burkholderiales bacterium]